MAARSKKSKEEWKVWGDVFDEFTLRTLFKLESQGHFDVMKSPIAIGKEANAFTAEKNGELVVVKIYRLGTCDFNRMYEYIRQDPRFEGLTKKRRKVIFAWTQREYRNLLKAREVGVHCPTPYAFLNNVLVMECILDGEEVAPKLKDKAPKNPEKAYKQIIEDMKKLHSIKLVHGDLSEYNILNQSGLPVLIDLSHGHSVESQKGAELTIRDVKNICRYFF